MVPLAYKEKLSKAPNLLDVKAVMESSKAYIGIFPEKIELLKITRALLVRMATVEPSFS